MGQQVLTDATIGGTVDRTAATGTVDLSEWTSERPKGSVYIVVGGGTTATFTLQKGVTSAGADSTESAGVASAEFTWDNGPLPYCAVLWASNTDTVTVEAIISDGV